MVPRGIEIDQNRDELTGGVRMHLAVAGSTMAANRNRRGPARQAHLKFFFDGPAKPLGFECLHHRLEARPEPQTLYREAAGMLDRRVIGIDFTYCFGFYEAGDDDMIIWITAQGGRAKSLPIEEIHRVCSDVERDSSRKMNPGPNFPEIGEPLPIILHSNPKYQIRFRCAELCCRLFNRAAPFALPFHGRRADELSRFQQ